MGQITSLNHSPVPLNGDDDIDSQLILHSMNKLMNEKEIEEINIEGEDIARRYNVQSFNIGAVSSGPVVNFISAKINSSFTLTKEWDFIIWGYFNPDGDDPDNEDENDDDDEKHENGKENGKIDEDIGENGNGGKKMKLNGGENINGMEENNGEEDYDKKAWIVFVHRRPGHLFLEYEPRIGDVESLTWTKENHKRFTSMGKERIMTVLACNRYSNEFGEIPKELLLDHLLPFLGDFFDIPVVEGEKTENLEIEIISKNIDPYPTVGIYLSTESLDRDQVLHEQSHAYEGHCYLVSPKEYGMPTYERTSLSLMDR
jgi:hypothetical protein